MEKKVGLLYSEDFITYNFGKTHPLKPIRLELTYKLFKELGLMSHPKIEIIAPEMATEQDLMMLHSEEYVKTVKKLSEDPANPTAKGWKYGLGPGDNPIFKGMYEASALIAGASIKAAEMIMNQSENYNIIFNPAGGLHHAHKDQASGFCIFNDVALAIKKMKLLKPDIRITYLDIDAHHGDGVQWFYYKDPNVLTISFHESGRYLFPGTGDVNEIGDGDGKYFSINFPLLPGFYDDLYVNLLRNIIPEILNIYKPDVLVTQLGVDAYNLDPLTQLGLSLSGYREIAKEIHQYSKKYCKNKWLAVGGGGYLVTVVPRAWSIFLAEMLDVELNNDLPKEWKKECHINASDEIAPTTMFDKNDKLVLELFSHTELKKRMMDYYDMLIKVSREKYIPNLKNAVKKLNF